MAGDLPERLTAFLSQNQEAELSLAENGATIRHPWGDTSLELRVSPDDDELIASLNGLRLPPRFTAVWHSDSKDFEVIWGPVPNAHPEFQTRSFRLTFNGVTYACHFGPASSRLMSVAKAARPIGPGSLTSHRNLISIAAFVRLKELSPGDVSTAALISFYVDAVQLDENDLANLVRHLNFYMRYFDLQSPHILLHEETRSIAQPPRPRYLFGDFPQDLLARELDPYLLSLWLSSVNSPDPFRRFLYLYQVLEYAAFYHVQASLLSQVRKALSAPDILGQLDLVTASVIDALAEHQMAADEKIRSVVRESVDPTVLWRAIEPNLDYFIKRTEFDGGFAIDPIAKQDWAADDFASAWMPTFPDTVRKLRNALVHARESRMGVGIAPTAANYDKIVPWVPPLSVCAMQIMLYTAVS